MRRRPPSLGLITSGDLLRLWARRDAPPRRWDEATVARWWLIGCGVVVFGFAVGLWVMGD